MRIYSKFIIYQKIISIYKKSYEIFLYYSLMLSIKLIVSITNLKLQI
jgi:hypothetical protein